MKQIIQDIKSGRTVLEEVPVPQVRAGYVLVKTSRSLVSLGTERMLVEFGKANLIDKARQQPDKVKQVLDKIKTDGLQPTLEAVFNKLGQPLPLGYCNVGRVVAVGKGVAEFKVDDRVVSNGNHAEFVCVPKNLVAKVEIMMVLTHIHLVQVMTRMKCSNMMKPHVRSLRIFGLVLRLQQVMHISRRKFLRLFFIIIIE